MIEIDFDLCCEDGWREAQGKSTNGHTSGVGKRRTHPTRTHDDGGGERGEEHADERPSLATDGRPADRRAHRPSTDDARSSANDSECLPTAFTCFHVAHPISLCRVRTDEEE